MSHGITDLEAELDRIGAADVLDPVDIMAELCADPLPHQPDSRTGRHGLDHLYDGACAICRTDRHDGLRAVVQRVTDLVMMRLTELAEQ